MERLFLLSFLMANLIKEQSTHLSYYSLQALAFHKFLTSMLGYRAGLAYTLGFELSRNLRMPQFVPKSCFGIGEIQRIWSTSETPGNYALSSRLIYPQIIWVQWNGGREQDVAMTMFFIKQVRSSLMIPMMIQVFKGIPGKSRVMWLIVNLPLTTDTLISWTQKGSGVNAWWWESGGDF